MHYTEEPKNLIEQNLSELTKAHAEGGALSVRKYTSITHNQMIGIHTGDKRKALDAPIVFVEVNSEEEWHQSEAKTVEILRQFNLDSFIGSPFDQ